jgi:hypothetical protein
MVSLPQVSILTAHVWVSVRQLRVNKRTEERDHAAGEPHAQDQKRRVNLPRDDVRVNENAGTDDPAHHDHRRIKNPQLPCELRIFARRRVIRTLHLP